MTFQAPSEDPQDARRRILEQLKIHKRALERKVTRTKQQIEEIGRQIMDLEG